MTDLRRRTAGPVNAYPECIKPVNAFANVISAENLNLRNKRDGGAKIYDGDSVTFKAVGTEFWSFHQLCNLPKNIVITGGQLQVVKAFTKSTATGDNTGIAATLEANNSIALWVGYGDDEEERLTDAIGNTAEAVVNGLRTTPAGAAGDSTAENFADDSTDIDTSSSATGTQLVPLRYGSGATLMLGIRGSAAVAKGFVFGEGEIVVALQFIETHRRDTNGLFQQ